ncbi:MAG TPA: hypothetical protein VKE97_01455 [Acidimicrobiia bacterium]|nr:hypothetical protein [Acidimicrobiia bacterium]
MTPGSTTGAEAEDVTERTEAAPVAGDAVADGARQGGPRRPRAVPLTRFLFPVSVGIAVVPIVVAATRAIAGGWIPAGDNAFFPIRARDVFTIDHLPLLGVWSSASQTSGFNFNHPGPLLFDLGALPVRLLGGSAGTVVTIALINGLSVVGIAVFANRRGGPVIGALATAVTATLCWTMGSEVLFEPWNPHSVLLPFLFFLVLVWAVSCGDLLALPFAAGVGSLVAESHLSYAVLVPVLGVLAVLLLVLRLRADGRRNARHRAIGWRTVWPYGAAAAAVLVVCWTQPLIEQFTSTGDGNLTLLARSATESRAPTAGFGFGASAVAAVATLPPWWFRPSFSDTFRPGWDAPSLTIALVSLGVLAVVFAVCAWVARRHRDHMSLSALAVAAAAMVLGVVTAARSPETVFGTFQIHTLRWTWPVAAFVFLAVGIVLVRRLTNVVRSAALVVTFAAVTVVVATLTLPTANIGRGPTTFTYALPATRQLEKKMGALDGQGPFLIDDVFRGTFADPYGAAVLAELQRRGVEFVAQDHGLVRLFGPGRRFNGTNARSALLLRISDATRTPPPGTRRVVLAEGLDAADRRELDRLRGEIATYIEAGRLRLDRRGEAALTAGKLPTLAQGAGAGLDADALLSSREVDVMVHEHWLALDPTWEKRFEGYARLHHEWDRRTVALFVGPVDRTGTGAR